MPCSTSILVLEGRRSVCEELPGTTGESLDLGALFAAHGGDLYHFALWLVHDPALAEDLVQDTFLKAHEKRDTFLGAASPVSWLKRILHNLAVDGYRRNKHEIPVSEVEDKWQDNAYTVDTEAVVERAQVRRELDDALIRLPFIYRATVVLHDVEGLSTGEIAAMLDEGLPAIKQRLRRGRMILVTALAKGNERRTAMAGVPLSCWDARIRVSDYLNGELSQEKGQLVEEHLRTCPTCPPLYAALVGVKAQLGKLRDPDKVVPPGLAEQVSERIAASTKDR
jgi:RNA polymerase sigma-70 factor (ECF subfamily)